MKEVSFFSQINNFKFHLRRQTQTCADASDGAVGACDIRIDPKVNVDHPRICSLDQDLGAFLGLLVDSLLTSVLRLNFLCSDAWHVSLGTSSSL